MATEKWAWISEINEGDIENVESENYLRESLEEKSVKHASELEISEGKMRQLHCAK
jgi:hypothetical protein